MGVITGVSVTSVEPVLLVDVHPRGLRLKRRTNHCPSTRNSARLASKLRSVRHMDRWMVPRGTGAYNIAEVA
jgi:hypothetical protein